MRNYKKFLDNMVVMLVALVCVSGVLAVMDGSGTMFFVLCLFIVALTVVCILYSAETEKQLRGVKLEE